jgi:hypothetical protein
MDDSPCRRQPTEPFVTGLGVPPQGGTSLSGYELTMRSVPIPALGGKRSHVPQYHNTNISYTVSTVHRRVDRQILLYGLGTIIRQYFHNLMETNR